MTSRGIEILEEGECRKLLHDGSLGRVGMRYGNDVVVLPVFYDMFEGDVVFRTDPGTKLMAGLMRDRVAFEVDCASPAWSVLVIGQAREIRDRDEEEARGTLISSNWPDTGRHHIVRVHPERITGRRLGEPTD